MTASHQNLSTQARENLPTHVAIIMDGNGRWAKQRHLPRVEGHRVGVESVRAVLKTCGELGIKYLTLYAFSVENWNRPKDEVDTLMKYLARYLKSEVAEMSKNNVRLEVIGQVYRLPEFVQEQLAKSQAALAKKHRNDSGAGAELRRAHRDCGSDARDRRKGQIRCDRTRGNQRAGHRAAPLYAAYS